LKTKNWLVCNKNCLQIKCRCLVIFRVIMTSTSMHTRMTWRPHIWSPQPRHTNPVVLPPSAGILVTHANIKPSLHDVSSQPHSSPDRVKTCRSSQKGQGHSGARASRDSPTLLSDEDDTSYSTWKAPVCYLYYSKQCNTGGFYHIDNGIYYLLCIY